MRCQSKLPIICDMHIVFLQKLLPCSDDSNVYAVDLGEQMCTLFEQHSTSFDDVSHQWLMVARKCLQVSLADVVRLSRNPTCQNIKEKAFDSHSKCFLHLNDGISSVCDIGYENWLRILVTVDSAMTNKVTTEDSLVSAGKCYRSQISRTVNMVVSRKETSVTDVKKLVSDVRDTANKHLSNDVFMVVLNSEQLTNSRGKRDTIVYATNSTIELLLVPRNKYDLNYNGVSIVNTNGLIKSFLDYVESGKITYKALDSIELLEYRECQDSECKTPLRTVKAPPPTVVVSAVPPILFSASLMLGSCLFAASFVFSSIS